MAQLAAIGIRAAEAGFGLRATSDHFQPWQANEAHSDEAWATLGAQFVCQTGLSLRPWRFGIGGYLDQARVTKHASAWEIKSVHASENIGPNEPVPRRYRRQALVASPSATDGTPATLAALEVFRRRAN